MIQQWRRYKRWGVGGIDDIDKKKSWDLLGFLILMSCSSCSFAFLDMSGMDDNLTSGIEFVFLDGWDKMNGCEILKSNELCRICMEKADTMNIVYKVIYFCRCRLSFWAPIMMYLWQTSTTRRRQHAVS